MDFKLLPLCHFWEEHWALQFVEEKYQDSKTSCWKHILISTMINVMMKIAWWEFICAKLWLIILLKDVLNIYATVCLLFFQVRLFWEHAFDCKFSPAPAGRVEAAGAQCTGQEDLKNIKTDLFDMSELRPEYNIYKAVYALAHALNDMLRCGVERGPFSRKSCAILQTLQLWQVC